MNKKEAFSIEGGSLIVNGIDTFIKFTRFHPQKPNIFLDGLELGEDLKNNAGVILYTKSTKITIERMARLVNLSESSAAMELSFTIKRTPELIQTFRKEIKGRMEKLLKQRLTNRIFQKFFEPVKSDANRIMDDILSDETMIMAVYKMWFLCQISKSGLGLKFFDHSLQVALFSLAMILSERYKEAVGGDRKRLTEIMKASIIHNYEALNNIDSLLQLPETDRLKAYWEIIRNGYFILGAFRLEYEIMDTVRILCEYFLGRKDFIGHKDLVGKSEWPTIMANIILVADAYLQKENGLLGDAQSPRNAIDQLNLRSMEKELNDIAVEVLTIGCNFQDIFDFYREIDRLIQECPYNSAWPYALTGFKSPTIFICKKSVMECYHIERTLQAVTLIQPLRELPEGKYNRCLLLTPKLISFYKDHYNEIKEETLDKAKTPDKKKK
ncbi:MAG: hypothetical protein M1426_00030 [Patescibacteria group bacterium]|nr:hypothetical protein [Patescibacteria group bacterium]